jgi:hypothetical protein
MCKSGNVDIAYNRKQVVTGHPLVDGVSSQQGNVYSHSHMLLMFEQDPNNPRLNLYLFKELAIKIAYACYDAGAYVRRYWIREELRKIVHTYC